MRLKISVRSSKILNVAYRAAILAMQRSMKNFLRCRAVAVQQLKKFMRETPTEVFQISERDLLKDAVTKEVRQKLLEAFFKRVFQEVYFTRHCKPNAGS